MLLLIEKKIRRGLCHAIHQRAAANNKYMKNYKNTGLFYLIYLDVNNQYGWAMSQTLPILKWKKKLKFKEEFIK